MNKRKMFALLSSLIIFSLVFSFIFVRCVFADSADVELSIDFNLPGWSVVTGENYALIADNSNSHSFFSIAGKSGASSSSGSLLSLEQKSSDAFVLGISNDSSRFISKMPELRLQGFFSTAINFASVPTATEVIFYISNLVADVSQYNKIDVLIRKSGDSVELISK